MDGWLFVSSPVIHLSIYLSIVPFVYLFRIARGMSRGTGTKQTRGLLLYANYSMGPYLKFYRVYYITAVVYIYTYIYWDCVYIG